jgi:signal peptidase I
MEQIQEKSFGQRHPWLKDFGGLLIFVLAVLIGTIIINTFVFRSFNVEGPSMETTLYTGDRLIVDRLPVSVAELQNKQYIPNRGQIIVFKNPQYTVGNPDEYIVKRVIAFPGERVVLKDGHYTVYNSAHPNGFNPDLTDHNGTPGSPTSGDVDVTVPAGTLFVSGDHRQGNYSYDSRNGLGYIPFYDVVGPVALRIFPFTAIKTF